MFSTVHPILAVRRQWERIVWIGGPHDEGSKEVYCHFQIERVDSKERLRHIEHEIYSVLKCVFTAVEDFQAMLRTVREVAPRLRSRRGQEQDVLSARAFIDWLLQDNYIFLGTVKYRIGPDGLADRIQESATGVFTDPTLLPVVFPGLMEEVEAHLKPEAQDHRIVDIDYCNNATAIHHLEPIDDIVIREWGQDGELLEATLLVGRLAKGAFTQKAADIPLLKEKQDVILAQSGAQPNSYAYREIRALFNRFPTRELFYANVQSLKEILDLIVYMTGDDEIAVHCRKGAGYVALDVAFSRLRYSYTVEARLRHGAGRGLRSDHLQHLGRPGRRVAAPLLLRRRAPRASRGRRARPPHHRRAGHDLGGPRGARPWRPPSASARAGASSTATSARRAAAASTARRRRPRRCPRTSSTSRASRGGSRCGSSRAPRRP